MSGWREPDKVTERDVERLAKYLHVKPARVMAEYVEKSDRACYCPIVYNSLEAFKDEMEFKR
jgi:hypothetical protein